MINLVSLEEAAGMVGDGQLVAIGGTMQMAPMAFARQLVRRGVKDLRLIAAPAGGIIHDLLIGAGVVSSVEFAQISLGEYGLAPNFRRAVQGGRLRTLDHT